MFTYRDTFLNEIYFNEEPCRTTHESSTSLLALRKETFPLRIKELDKLIDSTEYLINNNNVHEDFEPRSKYLIHSTYYVGT